MKIRIVLIVLTAFIVLCGASPWEGAGVVSPNGDLPSTGRYVATNSFPRNTVVDITNLETNKSTRAIVANTLDSPGLLAVVSSEAAEVIGMKRGSISRIRMSQPSDPIAYSRFTETLESGITDYDSGDVITEDNYRQDDYVPPVYPEQERIAAAPVYDGTPANGSNASGYVLEPEWDGSVNRDIVDLPEFLVIAEPEEETPPVEIVEEVAEAEPEEEAVEEVAEAEPEEEAVEEVAEVEPEEEYVEEIAEVEPEEEYVEEIAESEPEEEAEVIAEIEPEEESLEEIAEYEPEEEYPEEVAEIYEYDIVPADEYPPENGIYGIDPADIIPEITQVTPEDEPEIPVARPVSDTDFSIPRIYELARGQYYVQLAALDSAESVESTVDQIDRNYKPVVYKDGDHWYRVLLGPLNQGESAAILQRFKSIGYKDAFVRHVR